MTIAHRFSITLASFFLVIAMQVEDSVGQTSVSTRVQSEGSRKSRAMKLEDLFGFVRIAEPQLSPDGSQVIYQATRFSDPGKNAKATQLWSIATLGQPLPGAASTEAVAGAGAGNASLPRQVTQSGKSDTHPRFSPDGKKILFESNRDGSPQLYVLDSSQIGEAKKLTKISTGAGTGIWSQDGSKIAFVSTVRPEWSQLPFSESDAKNRAADDESAASPVKAKTFTKLFYRHWDSYTEDKRQHIFVINADGSECVDVTPGDRDAYPTSTTFSAGDDFCFTPDGKHLIVTAVPAKGESWTTGYDLCRIDLSKPSVEWETLTGANPAADCTPKFSPNGKRLAYRSQSKPGYEADKWNLMVVDCNADGSWTGKPASWTQSLDRSVSDFVWLDDQTVAFTAEENGAVAMYRVGTDAKPSRVELDFGDQRAGQITALQTAGGKVVVSRAVMNRPAELYMGSARSLGVMKKITTENDSLANELELVRPESVRVDVEGSTTMQMWILKPPAFDGSKKWPVVYLIHGGPQGAWEDGWSFRWNPQLWAAQGYVVVLPNPRGSTGFGQNFCDEISGDWGGKCYRDLVAGLSYVKKLPYVDDSRIASAGASFGGYMQDWFAVNEIAKEFRCLITHCSVYNFESMWGTTDELWFDEYEHGGLPWEIPGKYREFSPHTLAGNLGKYKTPMLVIHNDLDFRCPIGQGHELFQALQRQGVPSRFVNFPDEGHWVSKAANSIHWHREVFGWLTKYCPPGAK